MPLGLAVAADLGAQTADDLDYRPGERAKADIVTPLDLVVFDASRTEELRKAEAARVPPIHRFELTANDGAEAALRQRFAATRRRFVDALEGRFRHRVLTTTELSDPAFAEVVAAFAMQERDFPMNRSLAELWALGDPADVILERLVARLTGLATRPIRAESSAAAEMPGASFIRLVPVSERAAPLTLANTEQAGNTIPASSLTTLSKLRQELEHGSQLEEKAASALLTGLLRPNCFFDAELTRQARARQIEAVNALDRYPAGTVLVKRGQRIDARIQRALAELKGRTAAERVKAKAEAEKARLATEAAASQSAILRAAEAQAASVQAQAERARQWNRGLLAGLAGALALCAAFVGLWLRRQAAFRPAGAGRLPAPLTAVDATESVWRARALAAEARAEKATALLRARLLPQLARWMMGEMLGRLLSQRSALLSSQQQAEREVAELAARLDDVHAPLEERLRAYEQRVAALEAELALKDQQNRELIQARIAAARGRLNQERREPPPAWN